MTKKLSFSAVFAALGVIGLFGSVFLPTGKAACLVTACACVLVTVSECGIKYGIMQYITTSLIGALFLPPKLQIVLFVCFLGFYPIIKAWIEKLHNIVGEWVLKIITFNIIACLLLLVLYYLLPFIIGNSAIQMLKNHLIICIVCSEIAFAVYDYALSLFAKIYHDAISPRIHRKVDSI